MVSIDSTIFFVSDVVTSHHDAICTGDKRQFWIELCTVHEGDIFVCDFQIAFRIALCAKINSTESALAYIYLTEAVHEYPSVVAFRALFQHHEAVTMDILVAYWCVEGD